MSIIPIEVCLNELEECISISQLELALTLFIRSHHSILTQNAYISLSDLKYLTSLSSEMVSKLLLVDNSSSSSEIAPLKVEIMIAAHIKRLYVGQVHTDLESSISLDEISRCLENIQTVELFQKQNSTLDLESSCFHFIFYKNTDTSFPIRSLIETASKSIIENFDDITLCSPNSNSGLKTHRLSDVFEEQMDLRYIEESIKYQTNPNSKYDSLWSNLKLNHLFQNQILNQISQVIDVENPTDQNNLFLFHGPPGSGKSTLCRAISQKLSIYHQFTSSFQNSTLVLEISSEQIFSKWYGESSQNLIKLFQILSKIIEHYLDSLVILIIDEIETLANSRSQMLSKNETSDGVRIVNTLLTQLDFLKRYPNYVILATSNLIESIDNAFLDRVDGCFFIDKPNIDAKYEILNQKINELHAKNVIDWDSSHEGTKNIVYRLCVLCDKDLNMSGREISKLPQIAVSRVLQVHTLKSSKPYTISINLFLGSLSNIVIEKLKSNKE